MEAASCRWGVSADSCMQVKLVRLEQIQQETQGNAQGLTAVRMGHGKHTVAV